MNITKALQIFFIALTIMITVIFGAVAIAVIVTIIGLIVALFVLGWLVGIPISINRSGKKIGTLRWFKYTKVGAK